MLSLWMEGNLTRVALCGRTLRTARTGQAILLPKLYMDAITSMSMVGPLPFATGFALRTGDPMSFPINGKVAHAKTLPRSSLPTRVNNDGTKEFDSVVVRAPYEVRAIHISCIQGMHRGQEMFLGQGLMNRLRFLNILGRGGGGLHMDQQMWPLFITGFRQMHFVSSPDRTALDTHMCIGIIGGGNEHRGWR